MHHERLRGDDDRDAHSRDYYCILLEDCTEPIGNGAKGYIGVRRAGNTSGGANYDATLVLVQTIFGWVSDSESVVNAFDVKQAIVREILKGAVTATV